MVSRHAQQFVANLPKTKEELQARYRGLPDADALEYYIAIGAVDPLEFVRLYLYIVAQKDPRIDLTDGEFVEFLTARILREIGPAMEEMTQAVMWSLRNNPRIVRELRLLAGI